MTRQHLPDSVWQGTFVLLGIEVACYQLSNGARIVEQRSFDQYRQRLIESPEPGYYDQLEWDRFKAWVSGRLH